MKLSDHTPISSS